MLAWTGPTCSERTCPTGDPLYSVVLLDSTPEIQQVDCESATDSSVSRWRLLWDVPVTRSQEFTICVVVVLRQRRLPSHLGGQRHLRLQAMLLPPTSRKPCKPFGRSVPSMSLCFLEPLKCVLSGAALFRSVVCSACVLNSGIKAG